MTFAFVWLLMLGDSYAPGIFASVYSFRKHNTKHKLAIMYTKDVSANVINMLKNVIDDFYLVDYLQYPSTKMITKNIRYNIWIDKSYTKWQCLSLPYDKVYFVDADQIACQNIDSVFENKTPASVFDCLSVKNTPNYPYKSISKPFIKPGTIVPKNMIKSGLFKKSTVASAAAILLSPNKNDYNNFLNMMKEMTKDKPFGFQCLFGHDEQSITYFYTIKKNVDWTALDYRYNTTHDYQKIHDIKPKIWHYINDKPWNIKSDLWPDVQLWWDIFDEGIHKHNLSYSDFKLDESLNTHSEEKLFKKMLGGKTSSKRFNKRSTSKRSTSRKSLTHRTKSKKKQSKNKSLIGKKSPKK